MTQGTVIWSIVLGIIAAVMFSFASYRKGVDDGEIEPFSSRLLAGIRRGRNAVIAWRIAFRRTAHLQRSRLTLDPFQLNPADLDGLDRLDGSWLHKIAESEIAQLVTALSAAQADADNLGRDRALACYDAAALLATEREDPLDLLGAVVLAREGQAALAHGDPLPLPACQVHPLHGPAVRRPAPKRRPRPKRPHAVCAGCERCPMPERDKRALLVAGIPYYRTSGFWAAVGFGALDPELPARVLEYMHVG
jgi:hypothetical protein